MGVSRIHIEELQLNITRFTGILNDSVLVAQLEEFSGAYKGKSVFRELYDCRGLSDLSKLSVDAIACASRMESHKPGSRLAIVIPRDNRIQFGLARAYQQLTATKREKLVIVSCIKEAADFLGTTTSILETAG